MPKSSAANNKVDMELVRQSSLVLADERMLEEALRPRGAEPDPTLPLLSVRGKRGLVKQRLTAMGESSPRRLLPPVRLPSPRLLPESSKKACPPAEGTPQTSSSSGSSNGFVEEARRRISTRPQSDTTTAPALAPVAPPASSSSSSSSSSVKPPHDAVASAPTPSPDCARLPPAVPEETAASMPNEIMNKDGRGGDTPNEMEAPLRSTTHTDHTLPERRNSPRCNSFTGRSARQSTLPNLVSSSCSLSQSEASPEVSLSCRPLELSPGLLSDTSPEARSRRASSESSPSRRNRRRNSAPHPHSHWEKMRTAVDRMNGSLEERGYAALIDYDEDAHEVSAAPGACQERGLARMPRNRGERGLPMGSSPRMSTLLGVASEALESRVHVEHETTQVAKDDDEVSANWFLSYKLMVREVARRRGNDSRHVHLLKLLHSPRLNATLIALLLIDVIVVFVELFLEGAYPPCELIQQRATSCCAAGVAAISDAALEVAEHAWGECGEGSEGVLHAAGLDAHLIPQRAHGVACNEHAHLWVHQTETWLSLATVIILGIFVSELVALLCALEGLFFRSWLHIFDLCVVPFSFALQLYILVVRMRGVDEVEGELELTDGTGESILPDDIQELILFSRAWRFVRVGHGIYSSVNDMVRTKQQELAKSVDELKEALRQMEAEMNRRQSKQETEAASAGLHRAHDVLTTLQQQVAY